MNIQAYIESGILEEYVLGTVSPQEKQEVECLTKIYPELKEELLTLEAALEKYAQEHQTPPPADLKDKIFAQMNFEPVEEPADEVAPTESRVGVLSPEQKAIVRPLWSMMAVAASVLLAIGLAWAIYEMSDLKFQNKRLATQISNLEETVAYSGTLARLYRDPTYKVVRMAGVAKSPESSVVALWNQQTNEVLLDVQKLPVAPSGRQYQLWSIVNGQPVDMGVLEPAFDGKILRMKTTQPGSAAFAITLEKTGGSPTPSLDEMYVMGSV
ncbi:hypothetical protein GCM10027275_06750 [Rhabdobacter roseus]|uniref:Anti-sigma-K factor RskA n=1 Tax=Rhabdobacter roseus TaxID=1655419 RepID=A0A840TLY9_9BACT|nr:anti-sigma factor [Rhabdobacter roseus]MBB5282572.1 anti-sigma-K factor RskA [Rhabdobacter roseus]